MMQLYRAVIEAMNLRWCFPDVLTLHCGNRIQLHGDEHGKQHARNGNGAQYVLVTRPHSANVELIAGKPDRIVGGEI